MALVICFAVTHPCVLPTSRSMRSSAMHCYPTHCKDHQVRCCALQDSPESHLLRATQSCTNTYTLEVKARPSVYTLHGTALFHACALQDRPEANPPHVTQSTVLSFLSDLMVCVCVCACVCFVWRCPGDAACSCAIAALLQRLAWTVSGGLAMPLHGLATHA